MGHPMFDNHYDIPDIYVRRWASACHLSVLVGFLFAPIGPPLVAFIVWRMKRDEHFYIDEQGRESVNFQFSMALLVVVSWVMLKMLKPILLGYFLGWVPILIYIAQVLLALVGALRAYDGEKFHYPFSIPFIAPFDPDRD
ncbi:MAG TPA: DUF4870 domain-containing protein [Candidatus Hydrogenedentes bacterium]|nr:DUF4870 domain-containing protein [Candidatus Hydrogenedentota bacterium]